MTKILHVTVFLGQCVDTGNASIQLSSRSSNVKRRFGALASFLFIEYSDQTRAESKNSASRAGDNDKGWESADLLHASFQLENV
jgi:hypothetical protein